MKLKKCLIAAVVLILSFLVGACETQLIDGGTGDIEVKCNFDWFHYQHGGGGVESIMLYLDLRDGGDSVEVEMTIDGFTASEYLLLAVGTWDLYAELFDEDDELVATGQGSAVVLPGSVTEVNLYLQLVNGAADVTVEWDEAPPLLIADVSHRPISVIIDQVGEVTISGLSRIGWDFQVIESPSSAGRTHKDPGVVTFPDIAMTKLRGEQSILENIIVWNDNSQPRSMIIYLEGLGGEKTELFLFNAVPVTVDATMTPVGFGVEYELSGLRFQITEISMETYTLPWETPLPYPGQWLEIEGVNVETGYGPNVLDVPAPGPADEIYLPSIRIGSAAFDWGLFAIGDFETWGNIERKNIDVVDVDITGADTGRITLRQCWPASITLFNPERIYGHSYLVDVLVACDYAEER